MDKNTLLGLLLMGLVMFGFFYLNKPSEEEIAAEKARQEQAIADAANNIATASQSTATLVDTISGSERAQIVSMVKEYGLKDGSSCIIRNENIFLDVDEFDGLAGSVYIAGNTVDIHSLFTAGHPGITPELASEATKIIRSTIDDYSKYRSFAAYRGGKDSSVVLENSLMSLTIDSRGGKIGKVVLKNYKTELTTPPSDIVLFDEHTNSYGFTFTPTGRRYSTEDFNFIPVKVNDSVAEMRLDLAGGSYLALRYTLHASDYLVTMDMLQNGMDKIFASNLSSINFAWNQRMARNEKGRTFEERNSGLYYKFLADSPDDMSAHEESSKEFTERMKWVAFKNQFFSGVVIPRTYFNSAELKSVPLKDDIRFVKDLSMSATVDYNLMSAEPLSFDFYFGPNDYPLLSSLDNKVERAEDTDLDLTRLVPLGWGLFRYINKWIVIPVFTFLGHYISNYGIIILLLTIFIKIILFPFTYKSYMSQAKMRVLAPEIKEINDKYPGKENAMVRQQKTMEIYNKAGASPFSGCLPMLLQMPILIAMFAFFPSAIELRGESFLWAKDLSAPDVIFELPFSIPFYGKGVSLFCLLMTVTNIIYTRINMQNQPGGNNMPGMKWMMYLMPVMFLFFFNDYASGLSYYYFLSLLITIVQTYIFRRVVDEKKVRERMLANARKPKKKSGFMARLEEAQRKQQAMIREQQKQQANRRR